MSTSKHPAVGAMYRLLAEVIRTVNTESVGIELAIVSDPEFESTDVSGFLVFWPHIKFFDDMLKKVEMLKPGDKAGEELIAKVKASAETFFAFSEEFDFLIDKLQE